MMFDSLIQAEDSGELRVPRELSLRLHQFARPEELRVAVGRKGADGWRVPLSGAQSAEEARTIVVRLSNQCSDLHIECALVPGEWRGPIFLHYAPNSSGEDYRTLIPEQGPEIEARIGYLLDSLPDSIEREDLYDGQTERPDIENPIGALRQALKMPARNTAIAH